MGEVSTGTDEADEHKKFWETLSSEEKMLVHLREELYGGSWDKMTQDLKDRLRGRPYIFKLANRIKEDLQRIEKLQGYEKQHGINLARFLGKGGE